MLFVVVDQPRIGRRRQHAVVPLRQLLRPDIAVDHGRGSCVRTHARERLQPGKRVERVPTEELRGRLHRTALAAMLVAPVRADLRLARKVQIEVRRPAR